MESVIRMRHLGTMTQDKATQAAEELNAVNVKDGVHYEARHRFAKRFYIAEVYEDVCDLRCEAAAGEECECKCEGANHQKLVA